MSHTQLTGLDATAFQELHTEETYIIDLRSAEDFLLGFAAGALHFSLHKSFEERIKLFVPKGSAILLIGEEEDVNSAAEKLTKWGYRVLGFLAGGMEEWLAQGKRIDMIIDIEPDELLMDLPHDNKLEVLDVRPAEDYASGHVTGATSMPLAMLADLKEIATIDDDHNLYIHCGGGSSAILAASILKRQGYEKIRVVQGGYQGMTKVKGMPITDPKPMKLD